jgi:hypothetical protein
VGLSSGSVICLMTGYCRVQMRVFLRGSLQASVWYCCVVTCCIFCLLIGDVGWHRRPYLCLSSVLLAGLLELKSSIVFCVSVVSSVDVE